MQNLKILLLIVTVLFFVVPIQAQSIDWLALEKAQTLAEQENKKVMIFAEAKWCGYCKKMYNKVFPEQSVQDSLEKYFYPVRVDIESDKTITFNGEQLTEKEFAREFRIRSTPTMIFLDPKGNVIGGQPGYMPPNVFDKLLAFVGADLVGAMPFKQYLEENGVDLGS